MNARRKYRWVPAWESYVPDGHESVEPLAPEAEAPRDLMERLRSAFAAMSVKGREAEGPGNCHLHPAGCCCYWCETAGQRYTDAQRAKALEW